MAMILGALLVEGAVLVFGVVANTKMNHLQLLLSIFFLNCSDRQQTDRHLKARNICLSF
jgi:hypothetical protein